MDEHPWSWVGFVVWVIITAFFVLNLVVAVICESLIELQNMGEEKRQNKAFKDQKKLIRNQTEYLHHEMKQMLELQKEIVASQLAMQEILLDIAAATGVEPTNSEPALEHGTGKSRLGSMIAAAYDEEPVYGQQESTGTDHASRHIAGRSLDKWTLFE